MNLLRHLTALLLVASAACGTTDNDLDTVNGKADGYGDTAPADAMVVVRNDTACFTDPCPTLTVIDSLGNVSQVAGVQLPKDQDAAYEHISNAGLQVLGVIAEGSWDPGEPGDVLIVSEVVGKIGQAAPVRNLTTCFTDPCPTWNVVTDDGTFTQVAGIDTSAIFAGGNHVNDLFEELVEGKLLVGGYIRPGSWNPGDDGDVFVVTRAVSVLSESYSVSFSGIKCVTTPCPVYRATDSAGNEHLFDGLNLDALELDFNAQNTLMEKMRTGTIHLRGFTATNAISSAFVLTATKLLASE